MKGKTGLKLHGRWENILFLFYYLLFFSSKDKIQSKEKEKENKVTNIWHQQEKEKKYAYNPPNNKYIIDN